MVVEVLLIKCKINSPRIAWWRIFTECAPLDCKVKPFLTVYNILASFSDLTNRPVQYIQFIKTVRLYYLLSLVVVSLKIRISFVPSHLTAKISITLLCSLI